MDTKNDIIVENEIESEKIESTEIVKVSSNIEKQKKAMSKKPPKKTFKEEMTELKDAFFPAQTPHYNDYPKPILLVIFAVYYIA